MTSHTKLTRADLVDALDDEIARRRELCDEIGRQELALKAALDLADELIAHIHVVHSGPFRTCLRGECVRFRLARREVS